MYTTPAITAIPASIARKVAYLTARKLDLKSALVIARGLAEPDRRPRQGFYHRGVVENWCGN